MEINPKLNLDAFEASFHAIDTHTVGEFTRIITSGFPKLEGDTMIERKNFLAKHYDKYRQALMFEPRGHHDMFGALLTDPIHPEADFGCADGSLLKYIHEMFPDKKLIGYDISPEMLQVAEKNLEGCNVSLYNNFENVISLKLDNATLILSSVIHEVYSYGDNQSVNEFWRQVFNENFRYIAIRDLTPRKSIDRMSDINDVSKVLHNANPTHLAEFQSIWGNISNNKNLVHFLMKYKWVENWAREVRENYFPITIEEFLSKVPNNYVIDYFYEFIMPQTQQGILKDFNILLKDTTHFKCILRKI